MKTMAFTLVLSDASLNVPLCDWWCYNMWKICWQYVPKLYVRSKPYGCRTYWVWLLDLDGLFHAAFRRKMPGKSLLHCWKVMMMWASEWVLLEGGMVQRWCIQEMMCRILIERCGKDLYSYMLWGFSDKMPRIMFALIWGLFLWSAWFAISYCSIVVLLYTFCYCGRFVVSQANFGRCTLLPHGSLVFIVHCMPLKLSPELRLCWWFVNNMVSWPFL